MTKTASNPKSWAPLLVVAGLIGLTAMGCSGGGDDTAPTNTRNSQYVDTGKTAADKIGAKRAAGHMGRRAVGGSAPAPGVSTPPSGAAPPAGN